MVQSTFPDCLLLGIHLKQKDYSELFGATGKIPNEKDWTGFKPRIFNRYGALYMPMPTP